MTKTLYFDCETGGTDSKTCALLQLAAIIDVDGKPVDKFCSYVRPFPGDIVEDEALAVNGLKREDLAGFPEPRKVYAEFSVMLDRHVSKFNRADKLFPAGHNVRYDREVLEAFARRCGDVYLGSFVSWKFVDSLTLLTLFEWMGGPALADYKLGTCCDHYGVKIEKAHDALADVTATRELIIKLAGKVKLEN